MFRNESWFSRKSFPRRPATKTSFLVWFQNWIQFAEPCVPGAWTKNSCISLKKEERNTNYFWKEGAIKKGIFSSFQYFNASNTSSDVSVINFHCCYHACKLLIVFRNSSRIVGVQVLCNVGRNVITLFETTIVASGQIYVVCCLPSRRRHMRDSGLRIIQILHEGLLKFKYRAKAKTWLLSASNAAFKP